MYYVYLLVNIEGKTYIGFTSDLSKRLKAHSEQKRGHTAKGPQYRLCYYEAFLSRRMHTDANNP